ncbi:hypothetical protein OG948_12270 [Embleya sp. NBC_00888]|uniref:hypothetical protein n=1 Tax=Embleya sp. NBC_00888 TaxID=2975960 RepID=UPI00386F1E1C|nr:hypothetical protein OG948_12270 [Embleya sp. NBC_00888]
MSDPPIVFPDIERLLVDYLKNRPELAGATVDNRPPPGFDGTQQVVLISRVGGVWIDDRHLDAPLVDIEVYGPTKTAAHGVALAARTCLHQARSAAHAGAVVTDVVEEDGPRWLPDYNHPTGNRYLSTIRLSIRPS